MDATIFDPRPDTYGPYHPPPRRPVRIKFPPGGQVEPANEA